jgi:hypothetical protein
MHPRPATPALPAATLGPPLQLKGTVCRLPLASCNTCLPFSLGSCLIRYLYDSSTAPMRGVRRSLFTSRTKAQDQAVTGNALPAEEAPEVGFPIVWLYPSSHTFIVSVLICSCCQSVQASLEDLT